MPPFLLRAAHSPATVIASTVLRSSTITADPLSGFPRQLEGEPTVERPVKFSRRPSRDTLHLFSSSFWIKSFRLFGELFPGKSWRVRPQMIQAGSNSGRTAYRASPETLPGPFLEGEGSDGSILSESEGAGEV